MSSSDPAAALGPQGYRPRAGRLVLTREMPARDARILPFPPWAEPAVVDAFRRAGIDGLWSHQASGADAVHSGEHCVIATGTASGKSLCYQLPALSDMVSGTGGTGAGATTLYLSPTKALAGDQCARLDDLGLAGLRAATYDGDTPADERRWIRRHASYVLTNPDMLHRSILPRHELWSSFWRALRYVVVDECHVYRGVFGAHVAAVLRRLRRVVALYRAEPTFVFTTATAAEPDHQASVLCGLPVRPIHSDGSPRAPFTLCFLDPMADNVPSAPSSPRAPGTPRAPRAPSVLSCAADLLADLVTSDVQTLVFTRSRLAAELLAAQANRIVAGRFTEDRPRIAAYRGGYLPEERRALESDVRSRRLLGLAATSALELGVDIAGLDAVILAGWPGTHASFWQRLGRAGRTGKPALGVFIAGEDPLERFLVGHPAAVLDAPSEACVLDAQNPYVLAGHLAAAALERPLTLADTEIFGKGMPALLESLEANGTLRRRPTGWYWTHPTRPTDAVPLRGTGENVRIVEAHTGAVLGVVDAPRADAAVHAGAVYLHQQVPHIVTQLDLDRATALVVRGDPGWTTQARTASRFDILDERKRLGLGPVTLTYGSVAVRSQVTSFVRRRPSGDILGTHPFDLPERTLRTMAVWWTMPPEILLRAGIDETGVPGAAHAAEHAAIGLLPLVATADRWDIGGVSTVRHPDTDLPTVMVYDGHPGGAGITERAFRSWRVWLGSTRDAIARCRCEGGCPSCVRSPKCGNGNEPLDKVGAVRLLDVVLTAAALHGPTPELDG